VTLVVAVDATSGLIGAAADGDEVCGAASLPPHAPAQISIAIDNLSVMRATVTCAWKWSDSRLRTRIRATKEWLVLSHFCRK
jgi:hypothetical protein